MNNFLEVKIPKFFSHMPAKVRDQCKGLYDDKKELFQTRKGSKRNHQAWLGGYEDHIQECLNIAFNMYHSLNSARPFPFTLEDVLFVMYVHDLEKLYPDQVDTYQQNTGCDPKEAKRIVREGLFDQYGFSDYISRNEKVRVALDTVEGENKKYSPNIRVMNELGAFCHCVDTLSSRLWFEYPKQQNFPTTIPTPDPNSPLLILEENSTIQ